MIVLELNGIKHRIPNPYFIPPYLEQEYLTGESIFHIQPKIILYPTETCMLCDTHTSALPGNRLVICRTSAVNNKAGFPLKICIYCKYWLLINLEHYDRDKIPFSIYKKIQRPSGVNRYL